jgi:molecular chaperone GrpE
MERDPRVHGEASQDESSVDDTEEPPVECDAAIEYEESGDMLAELEEERQRSAEYLEQAQRARAELVNYRRRTEEELARMQSQAGERIIGKLLPALDDLNRAIESLGEEERESSWAEGILLIQRKLWSILESEGVQPIESLGKPFDPSLHEAISIQDGSDGATTVVQEFQRGYMLGDRVLRPAMVVVGSKDNAPEREANQADEAEKDNNSDTQ